jgi:hypothetical protein
VRWSSSCRGYGFELDALRVKALEGVGRVEVVELRIVRYCDRGAAMFRHGCSRLVGSFSCRRATMCCAPEVAPPVPGGNKRSSRGRVEIVNRRRVVE